MPLPQFSTIKNKKILVDSCLLIYCGDEALKAEAKAVLRTLADNNNSLSISDICVFEVLKNRLSSDAFEYYLSLLKHLDKIAIHRMALANAAKLGHMYKGEKKEPDDKNKQGDKGPHTGDLIIGGTAIFHDALVLTCDKRDGFSWSHWEPIAYGVMTYENGFVTHLINVYLLRFRQQDSLPKGFLTEKTFDGKVVSMRDLRGDSVEA